MSSGLLAQLTGQSGLSLRAVAGAFAAEADATGAIIHISDGQELTVGAAHPSAPGAEAVLRIPIGQGVSGLVARNGHAMRLSEDRPRNPIHCELLGIGAGGSVARICLPARGPVGRIFGVVAVHRSTDEPFSDEDVTRLQPYADLLGLRLQLTDLMSAVDTHQSERDRLIAQAISAQEAERRRVAFDLHDGVTTALASMSFHLNAADLSISSAGTGTAIDQARSQITTARSLADLAYNQTRAAITGLHSLVLDDLGLVAALESLVEVAPDVSMELHADPAESFEPLPDHVAAAFFRIAQETTNNAVKHARAGRVTLSLRRVDDAIVLGISDDGVGFDVRAQLGDRGRADAEVGHYGLSSIAERCALVGATLRIESMPGKGTTIIVELPFGAEDPTDDTIDDPTGTRPARSRFGPRSSESGSDAGD